MLFYEGLNRQELLGPSFFAVANFKGRRYIRITNIFAMGVLETYLSVEAIMPQNLVIKW